MFVRMTQEKRIRLGQTPAERSVFRKLHGVAHGRFEVSRSMDPRWRVGIFTHDTLEAWMRFSSDTLPTSPDLGSTLGIGIKLFGVPGSDGLGEPGNTADFLMQNFARFFVQDARAMCEFTYAGVVERNYGSYLSRHPETQEVLDAMSRPEGSVLTTTYWAILPFKLGDEIVKYQLEPETAPRNVPNDARDYLATDMANRNSAAVPPSLRQISRPIRLSCLSIGPWTFSPNRKPPMSRWQLVLPRQGTFRSADSPTMGGIGVQHLADAEVNAPSDESSIAVARAVYMAGAPENARRRILAGPAQQADRCFNLSPRMTVSSKL